MFIDRWLRKWLPGVDEKAAPTKSKQFFPMLEVLEDRVTPAMVTDLQQTLFIDLTENEDVVLRSLGTEYEFTSTLPFANNSVQDAADFSGFGTTTLTLNASGLARYSTISLTGSGVDTSVTFGNSGIASFFDNILVTQLSGSVTNINRATSVVGGELSLESDTINVNANLFSGGNLTFNGATAVDTAVLISSNTGDISFASTLDISERVILQSLGDVLFQENVSVLGNNPLRITATTVRQTNGLLDLEGNLVVTGDALFSNDSVLANRANITGTLTFEDSSSFEPEAGPGIVNSGSLTLGSGTNVALDVLGRNAGTEHDQVRVTGSVDLGGAALTLNTSNFIPSVSSLVLIDNDGTDAVGSTFDSLPEGSVVVVGNTPYELSYVGGTGNDVTLTAQNTIDFGDAPDTGLGTSTGNYNTTSSDNGPSHTVSPNLFLGATVDTEADASPSTLANGDDMGGALPIDEDGLNHPQADLTLTIGTAPSVNVNVHNTTGGTATLYGWIDFNGGGVFDNASEHASMTIADNTIGTVSLLFPVIPEGFTGTTYARFRLSTDPTAANPTGHASDGEVEDYLVTIGLRSDGSVGSFVKIGHESNGGPTLNNNSLFGSSVVSLGDLNGDGINDLAVGRPRPTGNGQGSVEVLFMNADGTVQSSQNIGSGQGGTNPRFGISLANIGDLDGDGQTDLLVGAPNFFRFQTGNPNSVPRNGGRAQILFLNADGTVKQRKEVLAPERSEGDNFGFSVASLGDLNGDGITGIAVGAHNGDTGGSNRGEVFVLFLNSDGSIQSSTKLGHNSNGGPSLANDDKFGSSLAAIGDLDGDGITELAVGAASDDFGGGSNRGSVHILFLNSDGTVRTSTKIEHNTNGGPSLSNGDQFGSALAFVGDLDGDGVKDLAASASRDDNPGTDRGSVFLLFLNADGTVKSFTRLGNGINGGPTLGNDDEFGSSISLLGDLNGDGFAELGVGAWMDDDGGDNRGAVYVLSLNPFATTTVSLDASGNLLIEDTDGADTDDSITIQSDTTNNRFVITDPNNVLTTDIAGATRVDLNTVYVSFASVTGSQIFVNTFAGDDSLTLDYSLGDFAKSVHYDGGSDNIAGDGLVLTGGTFTNASFGFTDATSDTVDLTGNSQLSYVGSETILSSLDVGNVSLEYSDTAETVTVSNSVNRTQTTSTAGVTLEFENPTTLLSINGGDVGNDSIVVNGLGTGFNAAVVIDGQGGSSDSIVWNTTDTIASLDLTAEEIGLGSTVSTLGDQNYNGSVVVLETSATLSGNDVTFHGTVDSEATEANALIVNTTGDGITTFQDVVGGTDRLASLTTNADGETVLGANVNTTSNVLIGDALTLTADGIIDSDGGNLTFDGSIDGAHSLTLNSPGTTRINERIGETTRLTSLTTDALGTTELNAPSGGSSNPSIRTTGAQNYLDAVFLVSNTALAGSSVLFDSTVDGSRSFIISVTQSLTFNGEVGGNTVLGALQLNTNGTTFINGGLIHTNQIQSYLNNVTFDSSTNSTTLLSNTGGITFARNASKTVRGATDGEESLILNANNVVLNASMNDITQRFNELTINAPATLNNGGVTTVGDQTYNGAVTLGADTTFDADARSITFAETIDGDFALNLLSTGAVTFGGAVGDTTALASISQTGGRILVDGGIVTTVGTQTYSVSGGIVLRADTTFTSTNSELIRFNKSIHTDNTGPYRLTVNGDGFFNFNVGRTQGGIDRPFSSVTVNGNTTMNGNHTTTLTTGTQTYNGAFNLGLTRTLTSENGGDITFASTIDRSAVSGTLTVKTTGRTVFQGAIGETTELNSLTTDAGGTTEINGGSVSTKRDQTYNDAVSIDADATLTGENVFFETTVDLDTFTLTLDVTGTDSEVKGVIGGSGNLTKQGDGELALNADNTYTGSTTVLAGLLSTQDLASASVLVRDGATLETSGVIAGILTVHDGGAFTPGGATTATVGTGDLSLDSGANLNLRINAATPGSGHDQLIVTGTVDLDGADLHLSGSFVFANDRSITILDNDGSDLIVGTFNGLAEGDKVLFNGRTVQISYVGGDGNDITLTERSLVVSFDGRDNAIVVTGEIGNEDHVRITTPSEGLIRIETLVAGDTISLGSGTNIGGFILSDDDTVVTLDATQFTMNQLQVNLGDRDDTLEFDWTFTPTDLDRIDLSGEDGTDTATITGEVVLPDRFNVTFERIDLHAEIETSGTQIWTGDIVLQGDSTLFGRAGASVTLQGKIDGAHNLSLTAVGGGGSVNLRDAVGSTDPLTTLFVRGRSTNFSGGSITTVGTQTYNGDFGNFLQADMLFTSTTGDSISFQRPVLTQNNQIGQHGIIIQGDATFSEGFGRTRNDAERPLEYVVVHGTTTLPGRFPLRTTGEQTYNGDVVVLGEASFLSTTGGDITFHSTLDRTGSVTISDIVIDTTGTVVFNGEVGGQDRLNTLVVNATNTELNGGLVNTRRNMTFNTPVVLGADLTLMSTRGGRFNDTIDLQSFDLTFETLSFRAEGVVSGTGDILARSAGGTFVAENTYTGQTILDSIFSAQTVTVENSLADGSADPDILVNGRNVLNLDNGATVGSVQVLSRGVLVLEGDHSRASTGSLILEQNSTYVAEVVGLAGAGIVGGHEQVDVTGTVTINDALLNTIMAGNLPVGSSFIILANDGIDPIVGTFSGFAEGRVFNRNGENFQITYQGGDGNDVVITRLADPVYDFTASQFETTETDTTTTTAIVTVTRTGLTTTATALDVVLTDGTATADTDFTGGRVRITFDANELTKTVPIEILGNSIQETDREFTLSFTRFNNNGQAGTTNPTATFLILDDDLTVETDGPKTVRQGNTVRLQGSIGRNIVASGYQWDLDNDGLFGETGANARFGDEVGPNPIFDAENAPVGTHPVTLRVTDGQGNDGETTTSILVEPAVVEVTPQVENSAIDPPETGTPFLSALEVTPTLQVQIQHPSTVQSGATIQLHAMSADGDSASLEYVWDLDNDGVFGETGSDARFGDEIGESPTFYAQSLPHGTHSVTVRVSDAAGTVSEASTSFQVVPSIVATGADAGSAATVQVWDAASLRMQMEFNAYPGFAGGVHVATADINRDGVLDIITGAGAGGGPHVKVFDGQTGAEIRSFFAYVNGFTGGVYVAGGDVNGDGFADIITGAGAGGGPHVKVFDGRTGEEIRSFFAYSDQFRGGVTVAGGDINGDGFADILTGAGPGGGPHVKVFDGQTGAEIRSFFAYTAGFTGGVYVASGDVNGDGADDILLGAGAGGGPHVRVIGGATNELLIEFFAFGDDYRGGVRVGATDVTGDGHAEYFTAMGTGGSVVRVLDGHLGTEILSFQTTSSAYTEGVFVAAGDLAGTGADEIIVGSGRGTSPVVRVFDGETELRTFSAYDNAFTGGVHVGSGDVNNDGIDDIITGAGAGGGPHVKVFDGRTGNEIRSFFAFADGFRGGVTVATGDINGDGFADIITGAGPGGGPHVKVFDGQTGEVNRSFFAYDNFFTGGVNVAGGDINNDGLADIVTGAGPGGGPHVKVFDGQTGAEIRSFFALAMEFTGGMVVGTGDIDGDGSADILTGVALGRPPRVTVFSGQTDAILAEYDAFNPGFRGGVRLAAGDVDNDGNVDLINGAGPSTIPHVRVADFSVLAEIDRFFALAGAEGGAFVS